MFQRLIPPILRSDRSLLDQALLKLPEVTYRRLHEAGFRPTTIIDVGAWHGHWSATVAAIFPDARFFMFDALEGNRTHLEIMKGEKFEYQICVLAAESGIEREFSVNGTGSSLFSERSDVPRVRTKVITTTMDEALKPKHISGPTLLKLDVQGAELEVLRGGPRTLAQCEVVQIEAALLQYNEGAPDFAEVTAFMDDHGFKLYEIAGFVRPTQTHLVQIDALFAAKDSSLRPQFFSFR